MSHLNPGLISAYNSLTDKHLTGYFSNTRIRRHLQRAGLITRSGRIVPDKEYRHKLIQRAHQRHVRECLAQAIFHKVLEMERLHQIEIKKKLEEFARRERVHKIKVERSRRYEEDIIRILSPRPPTGARGIRKQHSGPECNSESSESPGSSRPNTAPGKMQRPVRLKPIHSNSTTASLRRSSPYRHHESSNENDPPFNCTMDKECRRRLTTVEASHGISPYCLPVINNFVTPVPPATKRKERGAKVTQSSTLRGRRLRPTTASSGVDITEDPPMLRSSVHQSRVCVNMVYFGKTVHLSHDLTDLRDEVKVFQQHCGGENLCVYKGKLCEGESFRFVSRRHRGFPFSLTFFLNGLQVERLSSCCEFKHRKGSRLGGRHGHFGFSSVEGASPCYKCIIAMGLDKKPTPPPKRVKEERGREESVASPKGAPEMEAERTGGDTASEYERSQQQDMETQVKEETAKEEGKVRDDYEEDFEADDEGPAEEEKEKKSPPPTNEPNAQVKERDASETEDDERDEDIKSGSGSSCSGSDREASDAEATKESGEDEKPEQPEEVDQEESLPPPEEKDEPKPEEAAAATEAESAVANDSELQDSAGDSTEIDISDSSVPSGTENKQSDNISEGKKAEKTVDEGKEKEGQEQERAKSVQERLAEAMLTESHFTSEPELSDTTTEEEEEVTDKRHEQSNNDVAVVTATEEQQTVREPEPEVVQDLEETCEPKEQENETEKEPHESSAIDEMVKIDEEDENCEEAAAEKEMSEDTGADLHTVSEENMTEDDKTSEAQEGTAAEPTDADAEQKDEENVESTVEEMQPDEKGQGTKSSEEGESSVSELDKKTDEKTGSDIAEAEEAMTASETMEMKAEPSEEQQALNCEEAPVTDTEERQQEDGKDRTEASETEVTAENSADMSEKPADISEDSVKNERSKDDIKEEEAEEVLAAEASKDADEQEKMEDEPRENPVELDEELEKDKSEEESKQEEKQTNSNETPEGENSEEKELNETVKSEEEGNEENKTEERIENEEIFAENNKTDSNTAGETNEEPAEKTFDTEDKVANEERDSESEKAEKDKERDCEENKNDEQEPEARGAINDKTDEGEEIKETKTDAIEEKGDETEKDDDENKAEQSESEKNKEDEESEAKEVACETGEEISAKTEEPEKNADDVKISHENSAESQDAGDNEAAAETKTNEEMLKNIMESEERKDKETEGAITNSEKGEIDAESGEISARAESKTQTDEPEASAEDSNDVKAAEHVEDERKMEEEQTEDESTEVKEVTVKSGDDELDQGPDKDVVESEDKEGEDIFGKQEESAQKDSEQEAAVTETEEHEESKNENSNKSDLDTLKKDSDSTKDKDDDVHETLVAPSDDDALSTPLDFGLDGTTHALNESSEMSDKHPQSDENAAAADLSAADGENGENGADTEEASKASEEGASVLLKPPAQNSGADEAEEGIASDKRTPEALAAEDSADLVTNWVTMHQTSKFFLTFVEPLEELKEEALHTQESVPSKEAAKSTELPRSESPLKMVKKSESEEEEPMQKDESETRGENKVEAVESDIETEQTENGGSHENDPTKDAAQGREETVVQELIPKAETEDNDKEHTNGQRKGSRASLEDELQEGATLTQTEVYKTEVDSIAGTNYSVASGKSESVQEKQTIDKGADPNEKQREAEEIIDLSPSLKMEEHCERLASPNGLRDGEDTQGKTNEQSGEVTEITDFTTSKSEDGSQEEPHNGEIQAKPSDGSINGERRDVQLIQDIKHTLSKDRLSSFSVDETLFGRSSYPLLTAAKTESGH